MLARDQCEGNIDRAAGLLFVLLVVTRHEPLFLQDLMERTLLIAGLNKDLQGFDQMIERFLLGVALAMYVEDGTGGVEHIPFLAYRRWYFH